MDHAEREAAERDAEAPHVREEVRLQELRRVDEEPNERQRHARRAGEEQLALKRGELGDGLAGGFLERDH